MAGASGDAAAPSAGAPSPSPTADAVPVVAAAGATPPAPLSPAAPTPSDAANGGDRDAAAAAAAGSPRSADRAHARLASGKRVEAEFATTHPLSPELSASLPSRIMHMWVVRLVLGGWRSPLTDADLWELAPPEQSRFTSATFAAAWRSRAHEKKGRLPKTVWTIHRSFLLFTAVLKAGDVALGQVSPVFLNQLLEFLERPNEPAASGYGWAIALLVAPLVKTVFENAYFLKTMRMGIRVRSAIQATLYRKSLALSPSSRAGKTVGEIVNYMQLDAQRISDFCQFIHVTWAAPIQVIVTVALLYVYIGPSAFVGLAMAVVTIPLQSYLVKKQAALRKRGVGITDQRVKLINEVLQGIKAVKFYAWEKPFASAIDEVRERELANYRAAIVVRSCFLVIIMTVPTVIAVVTFAFYVGVFKEELTPSRVFTGIALLNQLRQPIMMLPFVVSALVDARVGAKRVEAFLDLDETDGYHRQGAEKAPNQSLARNTGDVDSAEVRSSLHSQLRKAVSAAEAARRGRRRVSDAMDLIGELPSPIPKSLVDADGATGRGSITVVDGEFAWDAVLAAPAEAATTSSSPLSRFKCLPRRWQRAAAAATGGSPADVAVPIDGASPAAAGRPVPVSTDARAGDAVDGAADAVAVSTTTVTGEGGVVSAPVLRDVNLVCEPGKVTAVIGRVGAGKSSLIHALLGEMRKRRGTVALEGTCAYVAQNAWIFNGTLRDNILFGRAYDAELYERAIHCSVLETDLSILPFGDATAIGEKGINLSGGQKQRVSLARAIYADADVYLLDDPLSALDAHVGADVFERCLSLATGVLRNRTVVLVTNQLHFLPECHSVIMLADGRVKNSGEFRTLLHEDADFRLLMEENTGARDEQTLSASHSRSVSRSRKRSQAATSSGGLVVSGPGRANRSAHSMSIEAAPAAVRAAATAAVAAKAAEAPPPTGGAGTPEGTTSSSSGSVSGSGATSGAVEKAPKEDKLITLEERKVGNVRFAAYFEYARACGGLFIFMIILGLFALATATNVLNNWWLSYWSRQSQPGSTVSHSLGFYLGIYCGLAVLYAALTFVRSVWYLFSALQASRRLQKGAIRSVMHAPLSFFDTTPIGRILSRFSRDTDGVDVQLPQFFQQMLTTVFQLIASYVYIAVILPWFIAVAIPIGFGYYALQRFFNRTSLELKRLDSISRSPIYAHFSETLGGLSTIRAYAREADFTQDNLNMVDTNVRAYFCYIAANRWFSLYLEIMGSMLVFATAILAVAGRGNVWAGDVGVALVYALQVTGILGFTVRSITELAGQMNSVERLAYYASELPQEAPHEAGTEGKVAAPEGWPARGAVEINNLKLRYREGLDLVLKGLTIDIKAGERVGVVGRTGAGKSSLMIALLRLVEAAEGTITVDGVHLASLGLSTVRRGVTIIPQDPVMFSGTLRFNIDPFEEFTEAELWAALEAAHLKAFVENFEGGLNSRVAEYGDNLSAGQRQLVCLARALLRKPQLLLLDEASSSLDVTTDALLQTTIRTALRGCTIITIAHRLSTIADYDRVLVLSDGLVADFDAPSVLLAARPPSLLRQLVDALGPAGAAAFERLVALADDNRRAGGGDADNVRRFVELAGAAAVREGAAAAEDDEDSGAEGGGGAPPPPLSAPTPVA